MVEYRPFPTTGFHTNQEQQQKMSDKMTMPAYDKVVTTFQLKAITKVKLDRLAKQAQFTVNQYVSAILDEHVDKAPTTVEDLEKEAQIKAKNVEARKAGKAKKGIR